MEYLTYIASKFVELFQLSAIKIVTALTLSVAFLFGNLYTDAIIAILMLIMFDTVFGVAATYYEGSPITSRRFGRVVVKGMVYFSSISAAYFADLTIPYDFVQATMIAFVGLTEFISILENIGRMGYETPKKLLNQLNNRVSKM